jgi:hypothetical protein
MEPMTTDSAPTPIAGSNSRRQTKGLAWGALQSDWSDPVVAQAIELVLSRHRAEVFWSVSPHERTQAIYDEIKRLDRARLDEVMPPRKKDAGKPSPSEGITG